VSTVGTLV
jgi:hypothetical protein